MSSIAAGGPQADSTQLRWFAPLSAAVVVTLVVLEIQPGTIGRLLSGNLSGWEATVLRDFRLPRVIMTLMIGSGMAISGWAAQKATRNPLASPDVLTVPSAASLGVMFVLWVSGGALRSSLALPLAAAGAGVVSATLLFALVGRRNRLDGSGLLLVGIAMGCLISAGTFLIALNAHPSTYNYAIAWLAGSLSRATWDYVWLLFPGWWFLVLALKLLTARVDVLTLEDPLVVQLGGRPDRWRRTALCVGAALAAVCVGVGGSFGFLGFVAPQIVRGLRGRQRNAFWPVACTGAVLLLAADTLGRVVMPPAEVPAGIVVSVLGAPCFVVALVRRRIVAQG